MSDEIGDAHMGHNAAIVRTGRALPGVPPSPVNLTGNGDEKPTLFAAPLMAVNHLLQRLDEAGRAQRLGDQRGETGALGIDSDAARMVCGDGNHR